MIAYKEKSTKWFIIYFHGISANFKYLFGPAQEVMECGVQLVQGFPPRCKWMYRGFFTQLLFHNPHSFSLIEAINSIAFF